jgi:hypothetical protein
MDLLPCSCVPGGYPLVLMATSKRNDPYERFNFLLDHRRKIMIAFGHARTVIMYNIARSKIYLTT